MKRNHINTRDVFTFSKDFSLFLLLNFAPFLEDVCVLLDSLIDVCGNQFARYFLKAHFFNNKTNIFLYFYSMENILRYLCDVGECSLVQGLLY